MADIPVEALARQAGFCRRRPKKITPLLFLQSVMLLVSQGTVSLEYWASLCGVLGQLLLSKQALWERLTLRAVRFLRLTLAQVIGRKLLHSGTALFQGLGFARILVQDSTLIRLSPRLAQVFPGSSNAAGVKGGSLRIQGLYDLVSQRFVRFGLSSYRRNDRAVAWDILRLVRPGDLVIRDLGYFVLGVFEQIAQAGAFFLSRLRTDSLLFAPDGKPLDLLALCVRHGHLDLPVLVGAAKVPARLVAIQLAEPVAAERRRRARHNRDKRLRPKARELKLLGWAIFITNVPKERLAPQQLAQVYGFRWRIEVLFKTWKSHFRIVQVPKGSVHQLEVMIYGRLLFLTAFAQACATGWLCPQADNPRPRSLLKLAALMADFYLLLVFEALERKVTLAILWQMAYHGRYDLRKRANFPKECMKLP